MSATPRIRASTVCREGDRLLVVRLRDPSTEVTSVFPPGGAVEDGETPAEAAARETLEETGVKVRINPSSVRIETYPYRWDGKDFDVTTHYFVGFLDEPFREQLPPVIDASYNLGASWLPVSEALEAMPRVIGLPVASMLRRRSHAKWRRHPSISGPAGALLVFHDQFRQAAVRLREIVEGADPEGLGRAGRAFAPFAQTLHHHHHAEEAMLFPAIEQRSGALPTRLVDDHAVLTHAIDDVASALVRGGDLTKAWAAVIEFDFVLTTHLDREEELVLPVLLEMDPAEGWALVHGV